MLYILAVLPPHIYIYIGSAVETRTLIYYYIYIIFDTSDIQYFSTLHFHQYVWSVGLSSRYHITSFCGAVFKGYLHSYISFVEKLILQWGWPTFKIWRKFWKPNYTKIVDVSWCAVSDASCESSAGVEGVRLIIRRLLIHRPNISRLSYTLLYCILKIHNTFRILSCCD